MIKKTITYTSYDGEEISGDFYFNMNKAELFEWECSLSGGMTKAIERIAQEKDPSKIVPIFKEMILKSYGVKSPDGKRFIKAKELTDEFVQTEAYSNLFMELATNADAAAEFVKGVTNTQDTPNQLPQKPQMTIPNKH